MERLELRCMLSCVYGVVGCGYRLPLQVGTVGGLVGETWEGVGGRPGLVGSSLTTTS